jgi:hypothetical protein
MHGKSLSPVAEARIFAKKAAPRILSRDRLIRLKRSVHRRIALGLKCGQMAPTSKAKPHGGSRTELPDCGCG